MPLEYSSDVEEFMRHLKKHDRKSASIIAAKAEKLERDPEPPGSLKLKGYQREYRRIRAGNFRIVYHVEDDIVKIAHIETRAEAYRKLKRRAK